MNGALYRGHRFDGRYAVAVPVWVRIEAGFVVVEDMHRQQLDREALGQAKVSEPYAHAPRVIVLRNGATLEVRDEARGFARELEQAGLQPSRVVRLQERWPAAALAVAAVIGLCVLAYLEGIPRVTRAIAFAMPSQLEARMGSGLLEFLDEHGFEPSQLDPARRTQIIDEFSRMAEAVAPGVHYTLEFRRTKDDAINAFALPGGVIVLLEAAVEFGDEIDEATVLGVLGHELGHVVHKHSTRSVLQGLGVGAVRSLLWGDFSGTAATVPIVLGQMSYSRDFESEADAFALEFLQAHKRSAAPLWRFFNCLQKRPEQEPFAGIPRFLSSHPPTHERMQRLRGNETPDPSCPGD